MCTFCRYNAAVKKSDESVLIYRLAEFLGEPHESVCRTAVCAPSANEIAC